ncbi:MAG TPA: glycosyltransferase family 4 protein [Methylomirabilota bacterium]|jgi:sugar transferase (PEP-CTERM/EpsH1 system associated)|nr:glycosyltransferase family 4 protein [Methylomirabilota bacterium]
MRILWVKVGGLWPPDRGGRLRSFHLISELSRRHEVSVVTTHGPDDDAPGLAAALPDCARVVSVPYRISKQGTARFALELCRSWLSPLPVDLWKTRVPRLRQEVHRLLQAGGADVCVADFLVAAPNVPRGASVPLVLFEHNVEHLIWARLCRTEPRWWRRMLLELEWRKMRRVEAQVCTRASLVVAVSDPDLELLSRLAPRARVRAIPTGVDTAYFSAARKPEVPTRLVFTGSMDWYPNEDAILHFVESILPAIQREVPDVTLTVVGRNPTRRLRDAVSGPGIIVTGTVDDVRPFIAESAVYVVPLRVGGGTRLKIFEALAMGKAVVSTAVGAEGLPLISGEHFVQADQPADFARAVVKLLKDHEARERLGSAGRRLVEARYSWAEVARRFESHLVETVGRRHRPDVLSGAPVHGGESGSAER